MWLHLISHEPGVGSTGTDSLQSPDIPAALADTLPVPGPLASSGFSPPSPCALSGRAHQGALQSYGNASAAALSCTKHTPAAAVRLAALPAQTGRLQTFEVFIGGYSRLAPRGAGCGGVLPRPVPAGSVVLAGQRVSHDADQLLPGKLASGGEIPGEVGGQDDDQDVSEELEEKVEDRQG